MAISLDVVTGMTSSASYSHAAAASGVTLALVHVGYQNGGAPSAISYGGQAMTKKVAASPDRASLWYLVNPPQGTRTVAITGGSNLRSACSTWKGTKNAGDPFSNSAAAATSWVACSSAVGQTVVDAVYSEEGGACDNISSNQSAMSILNSCSDPSRHWGCSGASGASSVTMSYNGDPSGSWGLVAASIIPILPGGNKMILAMSRAQRFYQDLKRGLVPPQDLRRRYQQAWAI